MSKYLFRLLALFVLSFASLLSYGQQARTQPAQGQHVSSLSDLPGVKTDSEMQKLLHEVGENYRNAKSFRIDKPVVVDFWATWCGPCVSSMPALARMYDELKDKGLVLIGVSLDDNPKTASKILDDHNYEWTNLSDPNGKVARTWGSASIPSVALVDPQGMVVAIGDGSAADEARIRMALHKIDPKFPAPASEPCK